MAKYQLSVSIFNGRGPRGA